MVGLSKDRSCSGCFEKQLKIDKLQVEVERLRNKVHQQERSAREGFFGSSTPSSKIQIKPSSLQERQERRGGAKPGHCGHGRRTLSSVEVDRVERVHAPTLCPDCGTALIGHGLRRRTVVDCQPMKMEKKSIELEEKYCPKCGHSIQARAPGVLPKCLYGNQLLTYVAVQHYLYGQTLGQIEKQTGIPYSSLPQALHALARRLEPVVAILIQQYRNSPVKHADETSWRTDGANGYAWLFATKALSLFRFRLTRAAKVAHELLGEKRLPGVLVVDRYNGYNKVACRLQYCYAHLLRDLEDLLKEFPENQEIKSFVDTLAPLLAAAMQVRSSQTSLQLFRKNAAHIKRQIIALITAPANHPAIQNFQNIFREKQKRLFHWATDPSIPADNNLAERDLRPLIIARKISFGSQSVQGAKTRETLMTVLHSLQKQTPNVTIRLKAALDQLAENPTAHPYNLLFNSDSS